MENWGRLSRGPFFALALVALVVACLAMTRDYAVPLALAVLIWFLINALSDALRHAPGIGPLMPGWLARTVAVIAAFGLLILAGRVVVANVLALTDGLSTENAAVIVALRGWAAEYGFEELMTREAIIAQLSIEENLARAAAAIQGVVQDAALVFLYVMFLMIDQRFFTVKLRLLVPDPARQARLAATLGQVAEETRLYLWLMSLVSLGVALITYVVCRAVGLEGAGFWAFLAFALNFIPTIGSILAVVFPAIFGLLTLPDPTLFAALIAGLGATQFMAGEFVVPRLMGGRLNLSSFVIILMLVVWGAIWGAAGMFLAVPITVILAMICGRFGTTRWIAILLSRDGRPPGS